MTTTPVKARMSDTDAAAPAAVAVLNSHVFEAERETSRSLEELIFAATSTVLSKTGLRADELDAVVLSGQDQTDGRVISCMVSSGPAAGVNRDVTMIASSADHALIYGYMRLLSGQGRNVAVIGWGKPSEAVSPEHAELVSAEPYVLRQIGMNHTLAAALQASRMGAEPATLPVTAWPLSRADLPALGDVVYAAVLAVEGSFTPGTEQAWISGAGWATNGYELGHRDVADLSALDAAVHQVEQRHGPGPGEWHAVEIAAPSEPVVAATRNRLGLSPEVPVNRSGNLAQRRTTPHSAGLGRMIAAAKVAGAARVHTVTAGIGMQGFAGQGAAIMTFTNRKANA